MSRTLRWTSADLALLPDDGKRREIIDGELYVSKQPSWYHQLICLDLGAALRAWDRQTGLGITNVAPGVIFAEDDDVAPDLVWISRERLKDELDAQGHLHVAPDLVIEVLSPGLKNELRDREAKLKLYARRGVREYWIVDWRNRQVEVYRGGEAGFELVQTLVVADDLESPLLPGFRYPLRDLFGDLP